MGKLFRFEVMHDQWDSCAVYYSAVEWVGFTSSEAIWAPSLSLSLSLSISLCLFHAGEQPWLPLMNRLLAVSELQLMLKLSVGWWKWQWSMRGNASLYGSVPHHISSRKNWKIVGLVLWCRLVFSHTSQRKVNLCWTGALIMFYLWTDTIFAE